MSELSDNKPKPTSTPTPSIHLPISIGSASSQETTPSSESDVSIERITDSLVIAFVIALVVKAITYLLQQLQLQSSTNVNKAGAEL